MAPSMLRRPHPLGGGRGAGRGAPRPRRHEARVKPAEKIPVSRCLLPTASPYMRYWLASSARRVPCLEGPSCLKAPTGFACKRLLPRSGMSPKPSASEQLFGHVVEALCSALGQILLEEVWALLRREGQGVLVQDQRAPVQDTCPAGRAMSRHCDPESIVARHRDDDDGLVAEGRGLSFRPDPGHPASGRSGRPRPSAWQQARRRSFACFPGRSAGAPAEGRGRRWCSCRRGSMPPLAKRGCRGPWPACSSGAGRC